MFTVPYNTARVLSVDLPSRPDSMPTCVIYGASGEVISSLPTVSLGTTNTTLSALAQAGAQSITVTSASGITAWLRFLIAGSEESGGEWVTAKSVSGTTVTLVRPLTVQRAGGATVQSTRVSVTVPAQTTIARGYRLELAYETSSVAQSPVTIPFDVTRYSLVTHATIETVRDLDPNLTKRLPAGIAWGSLVREAFDVLMRRVAQSHDPGSIQGTIDLTTAHGYLVRALLAEAVDAEYAARLFQRVTDELESALGAARWDGDGDGVADQSSQWRKSIRMVRA